MRAPSTILACIVRGQEGFTHLLVRAGLVVLGSLLLTLSAKVQVPFWPVPMTLQTYVVLVLAMSYGWKLAAATVLLYLAAGAAGLPVFAGTPERGIGLAYMTGATGGFLAGFFLAAVAVGWLAERGWSRGTGKPLLAMLLGHVIIFLAGAGWLALSIGGAKAWLLGVAPFLIGAIVKSALGSATLLALWNLSSDGSRRSASAAPRIDVGRG